MGEARGAVVVIGASAGGLRALSAVLAALPADYVRPVVVVLHVAENGGGLLPELWSGALAVRVKEAVDKEPLLPGSVYLAPPGYHLLVEEDRSISLSVDPPVRFSRPSIDVLFQSAAAACGADCIGIVLTGANEDGSAGLRSIREEGGTAIVQDPRTAEYKRMPQSALEAAGADFVLAPEKIGDWLRRNS
ncbi:chemotaxis protein CheB [Cohnella fermenti]|uniref:protein-glutamate methylesterase n=1 Tax=Cohnella fermenti TaxID=2565925 RepID=A0A4S4BNW8_9BACL|nr:chemotaxis protein CheB [Cohnella fermenti]THF76583.1 chemotaxis protein CheB [Cohnella fermenti]